MAVSVMGVSHVPSITSRCRQIMGARSGIVSANIKPESLTEQSVRITRVSEQEAFALSHTVTNERPVWSKW